MRVADGDISSGGDGGSGGGVCPGLLEKSNQQYGTGCKWVGRKVSPSDPIVSGCTSGDRDGTGVGDSGHWMRSPKSTIEFFIFQEKTYFCGGPKMAGDRVADLECIRETLGTR
ncbi:hypothetical protein M0802_007816 [Mischocyttarus mexicanus]|nr:hypothetical protein M0802_007816 [Mischocyttarus mexicanus]